MLQANRQEQILKFLQVGHFVLQLVEVILQVLFDLPLELQLKFQGFVKAAL